MTKRCEVIVSESPAPPSERPAPPTFRPLDLKPLKLKPFVMPETAAQPVQTALPKTKPAPKRSPGRPKREQRDLTLPTNGYYTNARGWEVSRCDCSRAYTGAEATERYESANLTVVVCPRCKGGLVIAEGTRWKPKD